jgi:hypothetical protein
MEIVEKLISEIVIFLEKVMNNRVIFIEKDEEN